MMKAPAPRRRNGATALETAIVISVLFFIVIGLIVGGMGVFRYQQVSCLSKEGARWASVRSGDYHKDTGLDSPTRQQIVEQAILTHSAGMDPAAISVSVEWIDRGSNTTTDWDAATKDVHSLNANGEYVSNSVRVTVTYSWSTGLFGSPSTYQSVCEMPLSY